MIPTPALVVERTALDHNIATIGITLPGAKLRPHVKAFKCTALAHRLVAAGHSSFTCATVREVEGMALAGLGEDLLLANEVLDRNQLKRLAAVEANVTLAVDSSEGIARAAAVGILNVLIDVDVGLPRCGCSPDDAGRLADQARAAGMHVRGVMGYEGHLMMVRDRAERISKVEHSMSKLLRAADAVGGELVSGGGTGTYDTNTWANEIQAGTFLLGDTQYASLDLPFRQAVHVECSILSLNPKGWAVANAGLKALGMDHGNPSWAGGEVLYCSDEHTTLTAGEGVDLELDQRVRLDPAHLDPTVARHEEMWLVDGDDVLERLPIDLRHW
ncbi:MAG: metal-activated pyridoxal enzyme [Acidimicrobiaceae bacterium]|nr:metal-activated pyridoxal enzyme [Acidimicrobiaceae bacterium]MBT5579031.1 metal-activated pyridoxal enzyme [Acidimicrobiaceae bacterium]MBT5851777.1 metal-activated pyridoxal enzyme [Acidimicrobiaceae bacterium]